MSANAKTPKRAPGRPPTHGGRADVQIVRRADVHKRRLLRQLGLRLSDLEGLGAAHLDAWARAYSKVRAMDEHVAEHGWLDAKGNPPPFAATYWTAMNTASRSLRALGEHLKARHATPMDELDAYIETTYARRDGN